MTFHRISAKGKVLVPIELRQKYGLTPGRLVAVVDYGGSLGIVPVPEDPVAALDGMFASDDGRVWTDEVVEEHRHERERDEKRLEG